MATPPEAESASVAEVCARALVAAGARRAFGIPGGGSSALILALNNHGLPFVLTRGESAAVIMAGVDAEDRAGSTPGLGVAVASLGPGAAATVNGMCHARLDRSPLILFTECLDPALNVDGYHQRVDHTQLFAAAAKGSFRVTADNCAETIQQAIALAQASPKGPVHVDLFGAEARRPTSHAFEPSRPESVRPIGLESITSRISAAQRPVAWLGLDARWLPAPIVAAMADALRMPVFTTYKAKGVLDETSPWSAGVATGAFAERALFDQADLVVAIGLDPVEVIPGRPPLADVVALSPWPYPDLALAKTVGTAVGDLFELGAWLTTLSGASQWLPNDVEEFRSQLSHQLSTTSPAAAGAMHPWDVGVALSSVLDGVQHVTVDAGAHMFPICEGIRLEAGQRFWISNGLSTMAYGLPAAIALSAESPHAAVVCCVGDGGLSMGAGELATASEVAGKLIVLLFDDGGLSLIHIKQRGDERGLGVRFRAPDWVGVARGFGWNTDRVTDQRSLESALREALAHDGPTLLAVGVDPKPYADMISVLRG